jgi:hypothetical protein
VSSGSAAAIAPERETPLLQALLPGWMLPDAYGRRGIRAYAVTGEGVITDARDAGAIGSGGNYLEHGAGAALFLLKEGGTNVPKTAGPRGARYLAFSTNLSGSGIDRSEYAPTHYGYASSGHHAFNRGYRLSFDLRIPARSAVTNGFFYAMQWWQTSPLPPVAGLRMKRGTSHTLELIARTPSRSTPTGLKEAVDVITQYTLKPGRWHQFDVAFKISPKKASGFIDLAVDGVTIGEFDGAIGSTKPGAGSLPAPSPPPDSYRLKFGIYKESEPGLFFVDYDNVRLGLL